MTPALHLLVLAACAVQAEGPAAAPGAGTSAAATERFLLIERDLEVRPVRPAEITERRLVHVDEALGLTTVPLERCIAILAREPAPPPPAPGLLTLSDGQRFPGQPISGAPGAAGLVVWSSPRFGRLEVPLDRVESVSFAPGIEPPAPGTQDVVLLANGDLLEGFIAELGDPISIELTTEAGLPRTQVPLQRVAAARLVTPRVSPAGRRVWLSDGTVVDAERLALGDDGYVRLGTVPLSREPEQRLLLLDEVLAILFQPGAMAPLADLGPVTIDGPETRFMIPPPRIVGRQPPLNLAPIELRGPLTAHYPLPAGAMRFAAEAALPRASRAWGDCELIVRCGEEVLVRQRLCGETPAASFNVVIPAGTATKRLSIEVADGGNGPIHDRIVLTHAMVLIGR
jgi:hypothetical protein